jgi:hypothetical protein
MGWTIPGGSGGANRVLFASSLGSTGTACRAPTEPYGLAHGGEGDCCFGEPGKVSFLMKKISKAMEFA